MNSNNGKDKNIGSLFSEQMGGNINRKLVEEALAKKDSKALLDNLSQQDRAKLNAVLNDKKALSDILKSPQAIALLKALGGKNG